MLLKRLFLILSVLLNGRLLDLPEVDLLLILSFEELFVSLIYPRLALSLLCLLHLLEVVLVVIIEFDVLRFKLIQLRVRGGASSLND